MTDRPIAGLLSGDWRRCILIQSALNYQRAIPALFIGSSFHYPNDEKKKRSAQTHSLYSLRVLPNAFFPLVIGAKTKYYCFQMSYFLG